MTTTGLLCLALFFGLGQHDAASAEALSVQAAIEEALANVQRRLAELERAVGQDLRQMSAK